MINVNYTNINSSNLNKPEIKPGKINPILVELVKNDLKALFQAGSKFKPTLATIEEEKDQITNIFGKRVTTDREEIQEEGNKRKLIDISNVQPYYRTFPQTKLPSQISNEERTKELNRRAIQFYRTHPVGAIFNPLKN